MDSAALLTRLAEVLDTHDWEALPGLLHRDFTCPLVHTGEVFDRDGWVRFNADYPGFERTSSSRTWWSTAIVGVLRGAGDREGRPDGEELEHFAVASFATAGDGLLVELDRGLGRRRPAGTRGHPAVA